jgi:hypothetical protein
MTNHNERGIAMVLALFLMAALSILAGSLMFLSQTETYASMNYRMMSQTRYAAESAVQKAANFLIGGAYVKPNTTGADLLTYYHQDVSPVTCAGGTCTANSEIRLAPSGSNYPVGSVITNFNNASSGQMNVGGTTINYSATARLITMQDFDSYAGSHETIQTWEITGVGSMIGARTATVQVVALVETPKVPANSYAAFATADTCGAMYFHGNVTVDSYDSRGLTGAPTMDYGGNVGTNGNLEIQGSVDVKGTLSTPRTGVGTCTAGAVTALTEIGSAQVAACSTCTTTQSMINLPKAVTWPLPVFTVTPPANLTVTVDASSAAAAQTSCTNLGLTWSANPADLTAGTANCSLSGSTLLINNTNHGELTFPNVVVNSPSNIQISGSSLSGSTGTQIINVNSLTGTGGIFIDANTGSTTNQSVVLKVSGKNTDGTDMTTPIDLQQTGWKQNATNGHQYDASAFEIVYGGTGTINMDGGNSQTAAMIYAPNAHFYLQGTQDLYGSVLAKTIENGGNASLHYDRRLASEFYVPGQTMAPTFTWKRSS